MGFLTFVCEKFHVQAMVRFFCICFALAIFYPSDGFGQDEYRFFYGRVLDSETKRGLEHVNLLVRGGRTGTVTGALGDFSFFTDSIPAMLVVSHLGYESKEMILDETSYSMVIYLTKKTSELPEVEIKANIKEAFFQDTQYAVMDYEIDSGLIYLLIYRIRLLNSELICKNLHGDTIARSAVMRFFPNKLFRDCMGYLHVLGSDSGFQIHRVGEKLNLIHPVALKKFDDVLKDCMLSTTETFYFRKVVHHGLGVEYFGVDRKTLKKNMMARVTDEQRLGMLNREEEDAGLLWKTRHPDSRDDFVRWNFVHKVLYRPIKTAIYKTGDYICIFNTPARQMEFYDMEGNFSYKLALMVDDVVDGRWTTDVLTDEVTSLVYTLFLRNGVSTLYRIDLNTGRLKKIISLVFPYPQKVRVYKGFVYYLYDIPGSPDNKMLYRERL